jgi:hypothetical protein
MFIRPRFLEAVRQDLGGAGGGAGGEGAGAAQGGAAEWLKPFGDKAPQDWTSFKEPAELATKWTELNTELTTLKGKDWRASLAGDDAEALKALSRYTDPKAFLKTFTEAQTKIRSGELAKPLGKDATPEQKAEWRKANGIPLEAKEYLSNLPDGLVIGKDDQPMFEAFAAIAHEFDAKPDLVHRAAKWYYDGLAKTQQEEAAVDQQDRQNAITELRNIYGNDYEPNMRILNTWLDGLPETDKALLMDATLGNGTRLFNSPRHLEFLIKHAREANPAAHLIPAGGEGSMMNIDSEIAKIEKVMRENRSAYNKDEKMQARYRDLITARDSLKGKK